MSWHGRILLICAALLAGSAVAQETHEDAAFNEATQAVRDHEFARAIQLFTPLAEQDLADAQFNLAVLYKLGRGYPQNFTEAYYWGALALLGNGAYAVDLVEEVGDALPEASRSAVIERLKARLTAQIDQGDELATRKLARLFIELTAEPDYPSAYLWFSICYALGDNGCKKGRDDAASELEPEALTAAQVETAETFAKSAFVSTPTEGK